MKKLLSASALVLGVVGTSGVANAAEEVNVYSYRQPFLIEPMLNEFTKETGIKVNVKFAKKGMAEKVEQEGEYSPADVLLTVDISRLMELVNKDLVQSVDSKIIDENVPSQYRDSEDRWVALTTRSRSVYSSRDRVGKLGDDFDYMDLAKPEWKGKICTRSGKHPYNVSLVSAVIANHGEAEAKAWLEGVKANLARKPQGNDRGQVKAISEGLCDVSLGNSYYLGKMLADEEQKTWADSVYLNYPGKNANGTHVNISGMAMAKYAPNKDNAQKLMEFLTSDVAQQMYAEVNFEEPVKPGVARSELVASWGEYTADDLPLETVAENHTKAMKLLDEVKFDL
ncbi:iron ABC transporter substrate-binding protein [Enterovibrio norvegicus]|uniref:Fe(3+) ABC transporter substrate-binding protein n=2 Tax=Enterovibrio norvegicus TaxID=188144 RepID=A0A2N7LCD3_9GAMM|nr:Fe(3+) ABC transporter substrate-binding protein [Enterovibrio norvegicus]MCC4799605.1 Fe(3+) ABC transporter substrate-binding protein [Enterovibrio norvegicus]OEF57605.1 iron ABC transporter substrate-binding protein [Enterovibrio norvegicus]OEF61128.1 iron ABC transporter substrate-binding protein [Enterovibrio norvegicus]PMH67124.1 iron ABC transporter substrate-binding protein [Enterovibrio norvegicus]PMI31677.1 iron ABC transporter substrate-binding protein [Enterovibrio norvegicus]